MKMTLFKELGKTRLIVDLSGGPASIRGCEESLRGDSLGQLPRQTEYVDHLRKMAMSYQGDKGIERQSRTFIG